MIERFETYKKGILDLIIETKSFRYSPEKPFKLSSGMLSRYYFDLRRLNGDPKAICLVARIFLHMIENVGGVRSVGGLESGSISIATAVSMLSHAEHAWNLPSPLLRSFYVRKAAKQHGKNQIIEGLPRSPAVIIDDVITTGDSALRGVSAMKEAGYECGPLMCLIFRGTEETRKKLSSRGFQCVFTEQELVGKLSKITSRDTDVNDAAGGRW